MRKHSARSFLQVMDGSNRIASFLCRAISFLAFLCLVKERLSCGSPSRSGSSLGYIECRRWRASVAHACGSRQPDWRSWVQSLQLQVLVRVCGEFRDSVLSLADIRIRSATMLTVCRWSKHLEGLLVIGRGLEATWYQAGSWVRSAGVRRIAARFT
jgi:hypothetical protein